MKRKLITVPLIMVLATIALSAQGITEDGIIPGAENVLETEMTVNNGYSWIPIQLLIKGSNLEIDENGNLLSPITDKEADGLEARLYSLDSSIALSDKELDQLRIHRFLDRQNFYKQNLKFRRQK